MSAGDHEEVEVGGELDEARLRAIMSRGWLFRNLSVRPEDALEYQAPPLYPGSVEGRPPWSKYGATQHADGETPTLVWNEGDGGETRHASHEVHMGCGEICGEFAVIPYDGDMGGVPSANARAIAHAGRDLIDLVREVVRLRAELESIQGQRDRERREVIMFDEMIASVRSVLNRVRDEQEHAQAAADDTEATLEWIGDALELALQTRPAASAAETLRREHREAVAARAQIVTNVRVVLVQIRDEHERAVRNGEQHDAAAYRDAAEMLEAALVGEPDAVPSEGA